MANALEAIRVILAHEGHAYVNDPSDPGGPTRHGVTLAWAKEHDLDVDGDGDVDVADLQQLTAERAAAEYRKVFWDGLALDGIIDQHLATKLLDVAVNAGPRVAATLLQRALNQGGAGLLVDGDLGPKTRLAANTVPSTPQLLLRLCLQQAAFYGACIQRNPGLETFRFGWMRRALWPFESGASAPPEVA